MTIRMTAKRKELLEHLRTTDAFQSASDLHRSLPHLDLATIYRNLELFVTEGVVRKYTFPSATEAVFEYQKTPHQHAICSVCDRVIHFEVKSVELQKILELHDFSVSDVELVVHGTCQHAHS